MKTLLFCTSFCKNLTEWEQRIKMWLDHHEKIGLAFNNLIIVDDGSPCTPLWKNTPVHNTPFTEEINDQKFIIHFDKNLGRSAVHDYPGWFRSFALMARYAVKFHFEKVIHIESDAFLLSNTIVDYINSIENGWTTLWCPYHKYPETAIQIIGKDKIFDYYTCTQKSYDTYRHRAMENCLPFTCVNKKFIGDRYLEYCKEVPSNSDYSCQSDYRFFKPSFIIK
jgi:hypothetical protein